MHAMLLHVFVGFRVGLNENSLSMAGFLPVTMEKFEGNEASVTNRIRSSVF